MNEHVILVDQGTVKIESRLAPAANKPKRVRPVVAETERPPPDLVKTTMRIFEGSVRRVKPRGDVAAKVATFKTMNDSIKVTQRKVLPRINHQVKPVNGAPVQASSPPPPVARNPSSGVVEPVVQSVSSVVSKFREIENKSKEPAKKVQDTPPVPEIIADDLTEVTPEEEVKDVAQEVVDGPKTISKAALDNIGKAGTTFQFSFSDHSGKNYLPGLNGEVKVKEEVKKSPKQETSPPQKQIGIIRPLVSSKTPQQNLSNREMEKNLINKVKSIEQPTKVVVTLKRAEEIQPSKKQGDGLWDSKPWNQQNNSMVFNFSGRKDVPDYIENDGLIISRKRDKANVSLNFFRGFFFSSGFY